MLLPETVGKMFNGSGHCVAAANIILRNENLKGAIENVSWSFNE